MKNKLPFLLIPVLIALLAYALIGRAREAGPVASGIVERDRIDLPSPASLRIVSLEAAEGDRLKAGEVILRLDDRKMKALLAAAEAERDAASAALDKMINGPRPEEISQAEARLAAAEGVLEERRLNLERARELAQKNFSSQADLDGAEAAYAQALGSRNEAAALLEMMQAGSREEDVRSAAAALAAAEASVESLRIDLEELTVRAPREGLLESLPLEQGALPAAGRKLATLLVGDRPYARIYIPEEMRENLSPGMELTVEIDGLEAPLKGVLGRISSDPVFTPYFALNQSDRGHLSYPAKIELSDSAAVSLKPGTPVRVLLPRSAAFDAAAAGAAP